MKNKSEDIFLDTHPAHQVFFPLFWQDDLRGGMISEPKPSYTFIDSLEWTPPHIARALHELIMDRQPIQVKLPEMTVPIRDTKLIEDCLAFVGD